jgi:hypothetical protein
LISNGNTSLFCFWLVCVEFVILYKFGKLLLHAPVVILVKFLLEHQRLFIIFWANPIE